MGVVEPRDEKDQAEPDIKLSQASTLASAGILPLFSNGGQFDLRDLSIALFDKLVYSKLRALMGGNVAYAVSGSAPLGGFLGHFFHSLGIHILEGYGLTETTAPATVSLPDKSKVGTVGPTLPGVAVRIADDGEQAPVHGFGGVHHPSSRMRRR